MAECCCVECPYAECRYGECHDALIFTQNGDGGTVQNLLISSYDYLPNRNYSKSGSYIIKH